MKWLRFQVSEALSQVLSYFIFRITLKMNRQNQYKSAAAAGCVCVQH